MRLYLIVACLWSAVACAGQGGLIERRIAVGCGSNLKQVAAACMLYMDASAKGKLPAHLKDLVPQYLPAEKVLRCLGMKGTGQDCQFVYVPGADANRPDDILAFCPAAGHTDGKGEYVTAAGEVRPITDRAKFRKILKQQLDARGLKYNAPAGPAKAGEDARWAAQIRRELGLNDGAAAQAGKPAGK